MNLQCKTIKKGTVTLLVITNINNNNTLDSGKFNECFLIKFSINLNELNFMIFILY